MDVCVIKKTVLLNFDSLAHNSKSHYITKIYQIMLLFIVELDLLKLLHISSASDTNTEEGNCFSWGHMGRVKSGRNMSYF